MSSPSTKPRRRIATIRLRLTLWSASITTGVCLFLCGILYAWFSRSLQREIDGFLVGEVHEMAALLARHADDHEAVRDSFELELGRRPGGTLVFRLKDANGRVLVSSEPAAADWETDMPVSGWRGRLDESDLQTVHLPSLRYPVRLCRRPFAAASGELFVAEAAYALESMYSSLRAFRIAALVCLGIAILASIAGGLAVAERSLRPVATLTRKAARIGSQKLKERLPLRGTGDELDCLAETLNGMLDRIEDQVRRIRQFTADASHELRSPLAVLRCNAEVVLSRPRQPEELRAAIERSIDQYDRLTRIADDLLLLAKADAGCLPFAREPVDMAAAICDVIELYRPLAEERCVRLHTDLAGPVRVVGDRTYLRQLIGNLVDNALKHLGDGNDVSVALSDKNGLATVVVHDNGPGIPSDHLPYIFDRFYRVDQSRSASGPSGSGLGLPICRMIAEAHHGTIAIDCTPDKGTTVTIGLPRQPDGGAQH